MKKWIIFDPLAKNIPCKKKLEMIFVVILIHLLSYNLDKPIQLSTWSCVHLKICDLKNWLIIILNICEQTLQMW